MSSTASKIGGLRHRVEDRARAQASFRTRRRVARWRLRLRQPTGRFRTTPDFLIIGAQRSGTSSLYRWLGEHPHVVASLRKEIEYFTVGYHHGEAWYRAHFPLKATRFLGSRAGSRPWQTFEATPDYLFDPRVPDRAHALLPDAKLIVLLRRPEDRAISHYHHAVRLGHEPLALREALGREPDRLSSEWELIERDPHYEAKPLRRYSYVSRSRYAEQLERWLKVYPEESMLIVRSEDLFANPAAEFASILQFLELPPWEPQAFRNYSHNPAVANRYTDVEPEAAAFLEDALAAPKAELVEMLGELGTWDRERLDQERA